MSGATVPPTALGPRSDTVRGRVAANGWILAAVWLLFLIFPLLTILADDEIAGVRQATSVVLLVVFGSIYGYWFKRVANAEDPVGTTGATNAPNGAFGFGALAVIFGLLYALVQIPSLGVVPFLVGFAVFHLSWRLACVIFGVGLGLTFFVPLVLGGLDDVWFLTVIVLAVGGASLLIRVLDEHQIGQATLWTQLAVSDERNRVARDVHDVLGHSLTAVILKVELCQRLLDGAESNSQPGAEQIQACRDQLAELNAVSRGALAEIRSTVGGLRATNLTDEITVARTVLADAGVGLLVTGEVSDIAEDHRSMLAWVVREAVTNIVRHARASQCHIELGPSPIGDQAAPVLLRINDDGVGFTTATQVNGNGLRGLRERVESAGATFSIASDHGTRIEVAL